MGILLLDVSKRMPANPAGPAAPALSGVTLRVPRNEIISLEGGEALHRTALLRLLGGVLALEKGRVVADGQRVSPILNDGGAAGALLTPALTVRSNIRFQARLSHISPELLTEFVLSSCDCAASIDKTASSLPWPLKRAIEATIFTAIPFDYYLVDQLETIPNFAQMQLYYAAQSRQASLIFATSRPHLAAQFRSLSLVMEGGSLRFYAPVATLASPKDRP